MKFCPECAAPTGTSSSQDSSIKNSPRTPVILQSAPSEESNNKGVWNVIVICITIAILMWPHGIFGITMIERATVNCEVFDDEWLDMEDECVDWKESGIVHVALLIGVVLLILVNINKSSRPLKTGSFEYQPDDWGGGALKHRPMLTSDLKDGSRSEESSQVPKKTQKKEKTEAEMIRDATLRTKIVLIFAIIALFVALQSAPLFDTLNHNGETSREKSSLNYILNCEIDEYSFSWENHDRYCTQKGKDQAGTIQEVLVLLMGVGIILATQIHRLKTPEKLAEEE
jgi:uncharacterized membrane protein